MLALAASAHAQSEAQTGTAADAGCLTDLCAEGLSKVGAEVGFDPEGRVRIAVILPFSAVGRLSDVATGLEQAAQMAERDLAVSGMTLSYYDSAGTAEGGAEAGRRAIAEGAALIIGPVTPAAAAAIAPLAVAAKRPMISLGRAPTGPGVFQLGDEPRIAVSRVVALLAQRGARRFGFMGPEGAYGDHELAALREAVAAIGGSVTAVGRYALQYSVIEERARGFAEKLAEAPADQRPQALMLPGGGDALQTAAAYLAHFGVEPPETLFFGNSAWRGATGDEEALNGALYAAPDPAVTRQFERRLRDEMAAQTEQPRRGLGAPPSALALAYDAVALAAAIVENARTEERQYPFTAEAFLAREGYFGVNGAYRFTPQGEVQRLLPVLIVDAIGHRVVDPAPPSFQ